MTTEIRNEKFHPELYSEAKAVKNRIEMDHNDDENVRRADEIIVDPFSMFIIRQNLARRNIRI